MTRLPFAALFLALAGATPAAAQNMPLSQFLERGTKLEKKGPLAIFQRGELNLLMSELRKSGELNRDERLAAEKAGRKPAYCPPANQKPRNVNPQQLLAELRAIPPAQARGMTVRDGMRYLSAKRYPCPA